MVAAMWTAFVSILVIGGLCARRAVAEARALDELVALGPVLFAMPLAVFGAEHLSGDAGIAGLVPAYMPWRMFWVYFVGVALVAAALSMATRILVVAIYGPILIESTRDPSTAVKVQGINYFTGTLLFAGAILGLAGATPQSD